MGNKWGSKYLLLPYPLFSLNHHLYDVWISMNLILFLQGSQLAYILFHFPKIIIHFLIQFCLETNKGIFTVNSMCKTLVSWCSTKEDIYLEA